MNLRVTIILISALAAAADAKVDLVTLPVRDAVQLTIYNSADLTLARESRGLTLSRGVNSLQFSWADTLIDPTSLEMLPLADADKIDVAELAYPPRVTNVGLWKVDSRISGKVPVEISYLTSGLSWRAFYMGTLAKDEKTMRLQGYVRVANNSGEDYENAQVRVIVGKVHLLDQIAELARRAYPYGGGPADGSEDDKRGLGRVVDSLGFGVEKGMLGDNQLDMGYVTYSFRSEEMRRKEITKEGLSEYFLYTIEGTETIRDKWAKRLISFDVQDIDVESLYKYDEERWGGRTMRFAKFANDEDHNLGQTPIPDGTVKIYAQADEQGHLSYVGGADIKYIPVDEEIELNLGRAREVVVKPKLMDYGTANYVFDRKGNIAGWDEIQTWKIEITNTRKLGVEIEITRGFGTAYWALEVDGNVDYEKHDADHARFKTTLEPRTKRSFAYSVITYHGSRQEGLSK